MTPTAARAGTAAALRRKSTTLGRCSLPCLLLVPLFALVHLGTPWLQPLTAPLVPGRGSGSIVSRHALGKEVVDDRELLDKIKAWKKTRPKKKSKGFSAEKPKEEAAPAAAAPPKIRAVAAEAPTPVVEEEPPAPEPIRMPTRHEAIAELLRRTQKDADPQAYSPQQLIAIFFAFFSGFRERHGISGPIDISPQQKQMLVLIIQGALGTVTSSKDFWPQVCAELANDNDPEMRELVTALTGLHY